MSNINKRVLIILAVLIVIAVVLIVGATVFVVKDIDVIFSYEQEVYSVGNIIDASGIRTGKNIFFLKESTITSKIQQTLPNVKVINIERNFPNNVTVYVTVREPIYAVKIASGTNYALVDREMFVLDVVSADNVPSGLAETDFVLPADVAKGNTLYTSMGSEVAVLNNMVVGCENIGFLNTQFCEFVSRVDIDLVSQSKSLTVTTRAGVKIVIDDVNAISAMVSKAYLAYVNLGANVSQGYLKYSKTDDAYHWFIAV